MKTLRILSLLLIVSVFASAQTKDENISHLQNVLSYSLYESKVKIDKKGNLSRKDNNGNQFKYALSDIEEVNTSFDGFHNVVITFKSGKTALAIINGNENLHSINVFAFANAEDCEKAKDLFIELISE